MITNADVLSPTLGTPFFWSNEERQALNGTFTADIINEDFREFEAIHKKIVKPLCDVCFLILLKF